MLRAMSRLADSFADHPIAIPAELESAWIWMEQQGFGEAGAYLTAYPGDRVFGPVFRNGGDTGWFEPGSDAEDRVLVIAQTGGDGTTAALWRDDDDRLRVVGLSSDGEAYLLADSVQDFLRLIGIGYVEISPSTLGSEPDNVDYLQDGEGPVAAHEPYRAWLKATFGLDTPASWPAVGDDEFTRWVARQLGQPEPTEVEPGEDVPFAWPGEIQTVLRAMGRREDSPEVAAFVDLLGVRLADGGIRASAKVLESMQVEAEVKYKKLATVWISPWWPSDETEGLHLDRLFTGLPAVPSLDDVIELLGEPTQRRDERFRWVRYDSDTVRVHFSFTRVDEDKHPADAVKQVTVMTG